MSKGKLNILSPPIELENDDGKTHAQRQEERLAKLKQNLADALLNPKENDLYIQDLRDSIKMIEC